MNKTAIKQVLIKASGEVAMAVLWCPWASGKAMIAAGFVLLAIQQININNHR